MRLPQKSFETTSKKSIYRKFCDWTNAKPVVAVVVVPPIGVAVVEVQVVGVVRVVHRTAPIVAVVAGIVERAVVVVAITGGRQKKQTLNNSLLGLRRLFILRFYTQVVC